MVRVVAAAQVERILSGATATASGSESPSADLEANGLVTRQRDVADERRVHVTLSAAGRKLKARAANVPACLLAASECSIDELVGLTRQLQSLRDRIRAAAA
ncbi:hypothetical protein [Variovorax sp. dw_308]|uniref:hypothetical protein n=1 Tax=Variovorax sp. dw_308 TaxID=2721546 RepID=UPI00210D9D9C|nr:hypothetical protein [Variovorax sp. dw_308]